MSNEKGPRKPQSGESAGRSVITLASGRTLAVFASLVTAPIIARLYLPSEFGVRQVFLSIADVVAVVACLRYELSIPLAKDESEASRSVVLSTGIAMFMSGIILILIMLRHDAIIQLLGVREVAPFLWLLPAATVIGGLRNPLEYWAAREGRFTAKALAGVGTSVLGGATTIVWALVIGASAAGMFAGYFAGLAAGVFVLLALLGRKLFSDIWRTDLRISSIYELAKRHRKFPTYSAWSSLINAVAVQLPPLLLASFFSTSTVGQYSLGLRVVNLPAQLLSDSVAQVFFPILARERSRTGGVSEGTALMFRRLVQISTLPMTALAFLAQPLFSLVFGQEWLMAGVFAQLLSWYILLRFVSSPLGVVFSVLQRQEVLLLWSGGFVVIRMLVLWLGARTGNPHIAILLFSIVGSVASLVLIVWVLQLARVSLRWGVRVLLTYESLACAALLPAVLVAYVWGHPVGAAACLGLAAAIYFRALYWLDPEAYRSVVDMVRGRLFPGR